MKFGIPENSSINLPVTKMDEEVLNAEKSVAKFVSEPQWKVFRQHLQSRIDFYKTHLPNGKELENPNVNDWIVANKIIAEFQAILDIYEGIYEEVAKRD